MFPQFNFRAKVNRKIMNKRENRREAPNLETQKKLLLVQAFFLFRNQVSVGHEIKRNRKS